MSVKNKGVICGVYSQELEVLLQYMHMQDIVIPDTSDHGEGSGEASAGEVVSSDYVRVKFAKFVQLVASHDFEEVIKIRGDEDILVGPNLLTDLANAHEEHEGETRKLPVMLLIGIILGIVVTYLVMQF